MPQLAPSPCSVPQLGQERAKAGRGDAVPVPARAHPAQDADAGPRDGHRPVGFLQRKGLPGLEQLGGRRTRLGRPIRRQGRSVGFGETLG